MRRHETSEGTQLARALARSRPLGPGAPRPAADAFEPCRHDRGFTAGACGRERGQPLRPDLDPWCDSLGGGVGCEFDWDWGGGGGFAGVAGPQGDDRGGEHEDAGDE